MTLTKIGDLEPDVTINGADLAMAQAGDGNWYAYFVAKDQASNAVTEGIDFGTNEYRYKRFHFKH